MVRVSRKGGLNTVQRLQETENLLVVDSPQISKLKGKPRAFKAIPRSKFYESYCLEVLPWPQVEVYSGDVPGMLYLVLLNLPIRCESNYDNVNRLSVWLLLMSLFKMYWGTSGSLNSIGIPTGSVNIKHRVVSFAG